MRVRERLRRFGLTRRPKGYRLEATKVVLRLDVGSWGALDRVIQPGDVFVVEAMHDEKDAARAPYLIGPVWRKRKGA